MRKIKKELKREAGRGNTCFEGEGRMEAVEIALAEAILWEIGRWVLVGFWGRCG